MKMAIYSRKSKLSESGESITNQIEMCKEYAQTHFSDCEFIIYEDEGFSGGNTDRPKFKKLMKDITKKEISVLICYRLDRISRNVADFSKTLEQLNQYKVGFVSIREQFDTTTPMGRAMMYIASVFAQLERETIAERVRDNMRKLAMTGRYLGSTPPTGFRSETITYVDPQGGKKKMHKLAPIPEEIEFVKTLYNKFDELGGVSAIETWLMKNGIKNKNDAYIGTAAIRKILTNPVYVRASAAVHDYFISIGANVINSREEFDGIHGMLLYGRHDRTGSVYKPSNWTVVLAAHEGIIDAERWLSAAHRLETNRAKAPRAGSSRVALLTSKIRCAHCGGTMVIIYGNSKEIHYYKCRNKIKSRKTLCDIPNLNGVETDDQIFNYIKTLPRDMKKVSELLTARYASLDTDDEALLHDEEKTTKEIKTKETEIKNLTRRLRENSGSAASKYIITDIETLDAELDALRQHLHEISAKKTTEQPPTEAVPSFNEALDALPFEDQKKYIDTLIEKIIWDGTDLTIFFRQ